MSPARSRPFALARQALLGYILTSLIFYSNQFYLPTFIDNKRRKVIADAPCFTRARRLPACIVWQVVLCRLPLGIISRPPVFICSDHISHMCSMRSLC